MASFCVYHIKRKDQKINEGYVGVTSNLARRKKQHFYNMQHKTHDNTHLVNAMNKYDDLEFVVLHKNISKTDAYSCEEFYRPVPGIGWNIKAGGFSGHEISETTKIKISNAQKGILNHMFGKTHTEKAKAAISAGNKGKSRSQEFRDKIKKARTGYVTSSTTKQKLRALNLEGNNPKAKKVLCIETGCIYDSVSQAASTVGIHYPGIVKVCNNQQRTAGGYTWTYNIEYKHKST